MNYTYKFEFNKYNYNTEEDISDEVKIKISESWHDILKELDRLEYNNEHTETRRHISYEVLEELDDYLIPEEITDSQNNPENVLLFNEYESERKEAYFKLYDKILRGTKVLTSKQHAAFVYRALCQMSFNDVAYHMRFECQMNENESSAKKHFYNAVKKIRKNI